MACWPQAGLAAAVPAAAAGATGRRGRGRHAVPAGLHARAELQEPEAIQLTTAPAAIATAGRSRRAACRKSSTPRAPGVITHIWFTIAARSNDHLKELVLRGYWDGNAKPSVEVPVGDFFGLNLGIYQIYSRSIWPARRGTR